MTTYRLFPSASGPALTSFAGPFRAGVRWKATQGGCWFDGWWWWVPAGGDTGAQLFALWVTNGSTSALMGSATSGTLTANSWNFVPWSGTPLNLAMGFEYIACTGWTAVSGFPDTGGTYAASPIVNGPLLAFSDAGGSNPGASGLAQGLFDTSSALVTASPPLGGSNHANFGMDVQIRDTVPAGAPAARRLWPVPIVPPGVVADSAVAYTGGNQVNLTGALLLGKAWFYSVPSSTALPDKVTLWSMAGVKVSTFTPSWSGAPGSGWVSATWPGSVTAAAASYRATVYCSTGNANVWFCTVNSGDPWGPAGMFAGGVRNGPLYAPDIASAALGFNYSGSTPGSTPPYTDGTQRNAQSVFGQSPGGTEIFPQLVAAGIGGSSQWYPFDIEGDIVASGSGLLMASGVI